MGAPSDIAAAHSSHATFNTGMTGVDLQHAAYASRSQSLQATGYMQAESQRPYSAFSHTSAEGCHLHFSMSGSLSNCSETLRADSVSAMDQQSSCTLSEDDLVAENELERRRHSDTANSLAATDGHASLNEQNASGRSGVQWQTSLQKQGNLAHSPHHHSAATRGSCLKQRPEGFTFWFADEAKLSGASAAAYRPFQACIKSIEGRQRLQQIAQAHAGNKRSRIVSFD